MAPRVTHFNTGIYVCDPSGLPVYDDDAKTRSRTPEYAPYDIVFKEVRTDYFSDVYSSYGFNPLRFPNAKNVHDMAPVDGPSIKAR